MATLAEVAQRSGVSKGLVSRVLNGKAGTTITSGTRERIREAARELNYRPNTLARALSLGRTQIVGLHYGNLTDTHFARMVEAIETHARSVAYHILVSSDLDGLLLDDRMDGLLVVGLREDQKTVLQTTKPVQFVGPALDTVPRPDSVSWSDSDGVYQAVRHFCQLGHRRIAGLFGDYVPTGVPYARVSGFRRAIQEFGASGVEFYGVDEADQIANGYCQAQRMLEKNEDTTAIFARNDLLALGALQALHKARIEVPKQMSVAGFGDTVLARGAFPRLSSVHTPIASAGRLALERLIEILEGRRQDNMGVVLPVSVTLRDSTCPPALWPEAP